MSSRYPTELEYHFRLRVDLINGAKENEILQVVVKVCDERDERDASLGAPLLDCVLLEPVVGDIHGDALRRVVMEAERQCVESDRSLSRGADVPTSLLAEAREVGVVGSRSTSLQSAGVG